MKIFFVFISAVVALFVLMILGFIAFWVGTYNSLVQKDQAVNTSWGLVQTDYQRRMDLIPNLVGSVKGAAAHEKDTLVEVTQARDTAARVTVDRSKLANDPEAQKQYLQAQQGLTTALNNGLKVVVERYPDLKANENFLTLQSQLEGTENRIAVSRKNNQSAIQDYNTSVQGFLSSIVASHYGYKVKPYFESAAGADKAPAVDFSK